MDKLNLKDLTELARVNPDLANKVVDNTHAECMKSIKSVEKQVLRQQDAYMTKLKTDENLKMWELYNERYDTELKMNTMSDLVLDYNKKQYKTAKNDMVARSNDIATVAKLIQPDSGTETSEWQLEAIYGAICLGFKHNSKVDDKNKETNDAARKALLAITEQGYHPNSRPSYRYAPPAGLHMLR